MSTITARIRTNTVKGEVYTMYSIDAFNGEGWHTTLSVFHPNLPIPELVKVKVSETWEEAGKTHLDLCKLL